MRNQRSGTNVVIPVTRQGDPHKKVDLVILAEGYQAEEIDKFKNDLKYYTDLFLTVEPYKSTCCLFLTSAVCFFPPEESGTDEPREGNYKNTHWEALLIFLILTGIVWRMTIEASGIWPVRLPYDAVLIMVNRDRYGGGGIYNWQTVYTPIRHGATMFFCMNSAMLLPGLADEYFSSPIAYVDFYTPGVEPLKPILPPCWIRPV